MRECCVCSTDVELSVRCISKIHGSSCDVKRRHSDKFGMDWHDVAINHYLKRLVKIQMQQSTIIVYKNDEFERDFIQLYRLSYGWYMPQANTMLSIPTY